MNCASDFRELARNALRGKWPLAILTGFLASLIGAGIASGGGGSLGNRDSSSSVISDFQATELWLQLRTFLIIAVVILVIWAIVMIVISGAGKLGYAIFNLKLVDYTDASVSDLFSQFDRLGAGFCMNFLMGLFTLLWSLLFVIPGIIKSFSYAMTPYILAEHPELTATEAITESRRIMDGNRWRLFCLGISFIGWSLLCVVPLLLALLLLARGAMSTGNLATLLWIIPCGIPTFIGSLFLMPYREAAYAAFYRDVSGTAPVAPNPVEQDF
ncbi:MAG: DUF975 family protein [Ruminococcaceae bacterium]|nr:DUF975 family protein [Oscillospiraceae bacterium]